MEFWRYCQSHLMIGLRKTLVRGLCEGGGEGEGERGKKERVGRTGREKERISLRGG